MSRYLTDGQRLYEIASQREVINYGLLGGRLRYTILRDCATEAVAQVQELYLVALSEVQPLEEAA